MEVGYKYVSVPQVVHGKYGGEELRGWKSSHSSMRATICPTCALNDQSELMMIPDRESQLSQDCDDAAACKIQAAARMTPLVRCLF